VRWSESAQLYARRDLRIEAAPDSALPFAILLQLHARIGNIPAAVIMINCDGRGDSAARDKISFVKVERP
jgi:hypothetical protein